MMQEDWAYASLLFSKGFHELNVFRRRNSCILQGFDCSGIVQQIIQDCGSCIIGVVMIIEVY